MILFISSTQSKVDIAVIDYAGLTTNPDGLSHFLRYVFRVILRYSGV